MNLIEFLFNYLKLACDDVVWLVPHTVPWFTMTFSYSLFAWWMSGNFMSFNLHTHEEKIMQHEKFRCKIAINHPSLILSKIKSFHDPKFWDFSVMIIAANTRGSHQQEELTLMTWVIVIALLNLFTLCRCPLLNLSLTLDCRSLAH